MHPLTRKTGYTLAVGILIVLFVSGPILYKLGGVPIQTTKTDKATARVIFTLRNLLNPHTNAKTELVVGEQTFTNLRGAPPFYLEVPGGKRILFVTQKDTYPREATLHILDMGETKTDIAVDITNTGFGWNIGSGRKPGEKLSDYIEKAQDDRIVISTRSIDWKNTTSISLTSKSIEQYQIFEYDEAGKVTNTINKPGP